MKAESTFVLLIFIFNSSLLRIIKPNHNHNIKKKTKQYSMVRCGMVWNSRFIYVMLFPIRDARKYGFQEDVEWSSGDRSQ